MQTVTTIKEMLKNYKTLEMKRKLSTSAKLSREMQDFIFLWECIDLFDDETKEIFKKVYIYGISYRELAKREYVGRNTLIRKVNKAIDMIIECFKDRK